MANSGYTQILEPSYLDFIPSSTVHCVTPSSPFNELIFVKYLEMGMMYPKSSASVCQGNNKNSTLNLLIHG